MKYYLIVGEASGDLHASNLMRALIQEDPEAEFRFFGGDLMTAVGGTRLLRCIILEYRSVFTVDRYLDVCHAPHERRSRGRRRQSVQRR